jgi:hypothetical protein
MDSSNMGVKSTIRTTPVFRKDFSWIEYFSVILIKIVIFQVVVSYPSLASVSSGPVNSNIDGGNTEESTLRNVFSSRQLSVSDEVV